MTSRQATILVVDDEKENCDLFSEVLTCEGNYKVECAYNGQQALEMAQNKRYDLIISDITMPKLDGLSLLKEVKRQNPDVEVVIISGAGTIDSAVDAFKSQAFDFLTKPLEIDRLLTTVNNALSKADLQRVAAELAITLPYHELGDPDLLLGHLLVDASGAISSFSKRLLDSLGIRVQNPKGMLLAGIPQLLFLGPAIQKCVEERSDSLRRWAVLGLKEHLRILAFSARYLPDVAGTPATLAVVEDITRIRRQEREKRDRERLSAIGEMTGVVSQQVAGLLGGILQQADLVNTEIQTLNSRRPNISTILANTAQACESVKRSSDRISSLLGTLQEFSRQFVPTYTPIDVNDLLQKAAGQIPSFPDGVEVNFDLADDLKPVLGNAKDLSQVFVHLITNACQAVGGKGTVTISTRSSSPWIVTVDVSDDGEGIPVDNLDRIFEPFFTTRGDKGKGLGLALARKVIDDHDGVINVMSQEGKGSTFTVTLPVQAA